MFDRFEPRRSRSEGECKRAAGGREKNYVSIVGHDAWRMGFGEITKNMFVNELGPGQGLFTQPQDPHMTN